MAVPEEATYTFDAVLQHRDGAAQLTVAYFPYSVETEFGSRNRVDIHGTVEGLAFRATLMPSGEGLHYMILNQALRKKIGKHAGDTAHFNICRDPNAQFVDIPEYLLDCLAEEPAALEKLLNSNPSTKRWAVQFVSEVKSESARANRIIKVMEVLLRR